MLAIDTTDAAILQGDGATMTNALHETVRRFILENFLFTDDVSALGLGDSLLGRGIVDSTGMLEVVLFIEEQLGIKVRDEEMIPENLDSVNRIVEFVQSRRRAAA